MIFKIGNAKLLSEHTSIQNKFGTSLAVRTLLPLQGAWVLSLIRELRSHMPCGVAKKKKDV